MKMPRWLTLPKSRNSLSDVLGQHRAAALEGMARQFVEAQVDALCDRLAAEQGKWDAQRLYARAAVLLDQLVPDAASALLRQALRAAIDEAVTMAAGRVDALRRLLKRELLRVLGLQAA